MIEVHLLRYVLAAADSGSFSRAADQFNIKQSTLSKRVQYLEHRLGLPLFRRSTRGVVPTDPGERFVSRARRIVQDIDALGEEARFLAKGDAGILGIGFHASLAGGDLSAILKDYRRAFPGVEIAARESGRKDLLNALDRGQLDLIVTPGEAHGTYIRSMRLWSDPVLVAMSADHPIATRAPLYWTDLRHAAFLVTAADPGPDISTIIASRLNAPGHMPGVIVQDVGRENLLTFVTGEKIAAIAGIGPFSTYPDGLVLREIHDAFGPTRLDQSVHWRGDNDNPALRQFLKLLSQRYARPIPGR